MPNDKTNCKYLFLEPFLATALSASATNLQVGTSYPRLSNINQHAGMTTLVSSIRAILFGSYPFKIRPGITVLLLKMLLLMP